MQNSTILAIALIVPFISASKCDDGGGGGVNPDSPSSLCDHIFDLCGGDMYDDKEACKRDVESMESCRRECAADQTKCEPLDQCLWWNTGFDGAVDAYCIDGSGNGDSYDDLDACAEEECSTEYNTCQANADCKGIFEDCLSNCSDMSCVETCANASYAGGIDDYNSLATCLNGSCSDYM